MVEYFQTKEALTLSAVAMVLVSLRLIARWKKVGLKNFKADDYLMVVAYLIYGSTTGLAYVTGSRYHGLANNAMTDEQRATLVPGSEEYTMRVKGSKIQLINWLDYILLLWLLKTCMALFYSRLTVDLLDMRMRIHVGYFLIASTYIAATCSILLACRPFYKYWQINPDPGNTCQPAVSKINIWVTFTLDILTDIYLISIPTPMLFKTRMVWYKKIELAVLFSGGLFVMGCGAHRCIVLLTAYGDGAEMAGSWGVRETWLATVVGNLPMIYPFIRNLIYRVYVTITKKASANSNDNGCQLSGRISSKRRRFPHPLSLPTDIWCNTVDNEHTLRPTSRPSPPPPGAADDRGSETSASNGQNRGNGIRVIHEFDVHSSQEMF